MKKLISLILVAVMAVSMLSVSAFAEEEQSFKIAIVQQLDHPSLDEIRTACDARLKELVLTEQGTEAFLRTRQAMDQLEAQATRGLSPQEKAQFLSLCQRIEANLSDKKECIHAKAHFIPD